MEKTIMVVNLGEGLSFLIDMRYYIWWDIHVLELYLHISNTDFSEYMKKELMVYLKKIDFNEICIISK